MAKKISTLANKSKIKFGTYKGKAIGWVISDKNHTGYPASSVTLDAEKAVRFGCFDARESNNSDSNRQNNGNNRWMYANLNGWLNSDAAAGKWFAKKHNADAAPSSGNVSGGNAYDTDVGFLNAFTANEKGAILNTTLTVGRSSTDGGGTEEVTSKVFLHTCTEVGLSGDVTAGAKLAIYSNDASRVKYATAEAAASNTNGWTVTDPVYYWLADAYAGDSGNVRIVGAGGTLSGSNACNGYCAVVPALNLSSDLLVSDTTDSSGYYTVIYNREPSTPATITVPEAIDGGKTTTVTWGESTDPDGNLTGYKLERQVDGGNWTQIYAGSARTYTDSITFGWVSVAYRVKAYDSEGAESAYKTGTTITVHNNQNPVISGTDRGLGTFGKTAPSTTYTVSDSDSSTVTVKTYLDNALISTATPTLGANVTLTITAANWKKTLNGTHTWRIEADDGDGGTATRTLTFVKTVAGIEFTTNPMAADDMPLKAIINFTGYVAEGAVLTIEICNNANDAAPSWEDITTKVETAQKHFFTNDTKTAASWAVALRVKIDKGTSTAASYITQIGGNFG